MRALPNLSELSLREAAPTGVLSGPEVNEAVHGSILGQIDAMPWEADFCDGLFNYRGVSKATMPSDEAFEQLYAELLRRGTLPMPAGYYTSNVEPKRPLETARSYFLRLCQACSGERKAALDAIKRYLTVKMKRSPYGDTAMQVARMLATAKNNCDIDSPDLDDDDYQNEDADCFRILWMLNAVLEQTWGLKKNTTPQDVERIIGKAERYSYIDYDVSPARPSLLQKTLRSMSPRLYDDLSFLHAVQAIFDEWKYRAIEVEEMGWSTRLLDIQYPSDPDRNELTDDDDSPVFPKPWVPPLGVVRRTPSSDSEDSPFRLPPLPNPDEDPLSD